MAMSNKEAAIRAIQGLPDDASTEDIMYAMYVRAKIEEGLRDEEAGNLTDHETVKREINKLSRSAGAPPEPAPASTASLVPCRVDADDDSNLEDVTYHLEREGWATVLVPDRPVPPITTEMVNEIIEEMRREREDRWLGGMGKDGE